MNHNPSQLRWHAIAVALVGVALLVNVALRPWNGPNVFPPFLLAVLLTSGYGGIGPGLTATALSLVTCIVLLGESEGLQPTPTTLDVRLALFTGVVVLIVYLVGARRQ